MAYYRIVCTDQRPYGNPPTHAHIVAVGTGEDPSSASFRWTLNEVIDAMDRGDVFFTRGERSGLIALVVKYLCSRCAGYHIKSAPDAVADNNLDSLRYCGWKKSA
jgi:hypothetical protein